MDRLWIMKLLTLLKLLMNFIVTMTLSTTLILGVCERVMFSFTAVLGFQAAKPAHRVAVNLDSDFLLVNCYNTILQESLFIILIIFFEKRRLCIPKDPIKYHYCEPMILLSCLLS